MAREIIGSSIPYGWLDARMEAVGWQRLRLEGRRRSDAMSNGRGEHVKADIYRGFVVEDDRQSS
jgi:hypothetical protein